MNDTSRRAQACEEAGLGDPTTAGREHRVLRVYHILGCLPFEGAKVCFAIGRKDFADAAALSGFDEAIEIDEGRA
jgi:hypothetical protein